MGLVDTFLLESTKANVWIALRNDQIHGEGSAANPYHGGTRTAAAVPVSLTRNTNEGIASTGSIADGFPDGAVIEISGVAGSGASDWNREFTIYDVTPNSFKFAFGELPALPQGFPSAALVTFQVDEIFRILPINVRVNLGPGIFQSRGYAPQGVNSWQPKAGQKIVGAGTEVTTLQLVGASVADQHYHAIGMNLAPSGTTPAAPVDGFEISDLTIDCNMDNQPLRGQSTNTPVACGAVRLFGSHCRIRRVKAINWGTKSLKEGCFVFSIIDASAETTDATGQPVVQQTTGSGIEDCIAVDPSRNCARETTVLHLGGKKNATTQAQAFGVAPFIRNNFVDASFKTSTATPERFDSHFLTSVPGTIVTTEFAPDPPIVGLFVGKRRHHLLGGECISEIGLNEGEASCTESSRAGAGSQQERSPMVDPAGGARGASRPTSLVQSGFNPICPSVL